ncbi:hypothetical protein GCM10009680_82710 [Streptomyces yatensis]|uniref:Transposase n=1 Tax=Streptomyces yatensis TaxID=155177 RepID=A0ABP4VMN9_9ACTN|nr:transposase [Streptomyces yatensis]
MRRQLTGRRLDPRVERVLFALVANRALDSSSKLAATDWIANDVHIDGLDQINDEACYRAMDWLLEMEPALAKEAYFQVTDLLNLEVDLIFFDTTSTYFETEDADEPVDRDQDGKALPEDADPVLVARQGGFRAFGKSKDSREDLPQVVVGMAVTRDGIPVRVWSWPGNHLAGRLSTEAGLKRFLRTTPGGLLRVDKKKIAAEEKLDGKYLLWSSDPDLSAEDIALGYKQLLEVERGWRDMKQLLDLRPVYHRREDRIRAHILLCWLALLLIRVAENATGTTWPRLRTELQRLHAVTYTGPAGTFRQSTDLTKPQRGSYTALGLTPPRKVIDLTPGR